MKIAILTSGILPVPAVRGGAVENLTDFYLEYNDKHHLHDITIYSVYDEAVLNHPALQSQVNHYHYIKMRSLSAKIHRYIFRYLHFHDSYYHYTVEFFLHESIKHICRQHYDIVILENRPAYALKLKVVTDAKIVYHLHNEKLSVEISRYQDIYNTASRILTVSDYIKSRVCTINPNDTKTTTVYNGINLSAFSHRSNIHRQDKGLSDNDFVIVYSGRVNKEKGIMELIDAVIQLKEYTNIKLLVIGSSFFGNVETDDAFVTSLKAKAAQLKERIIFTGFIPYSEMPSYLQMADLAIIPSQWDDPFPTTVLEAQAMGLPIISTCRGGIPEEVTKSTAILLQTDEHFVDNLASAILELYQHPEKQKAMSQAALEHSKYFSKERYAKDFFNVLESI